MKHTQSCCMVQLECKWSYWQYLMRIWLPVSMFKLRILTNIDDKSGVGRKICRCAPFFLCYGQFFLNYVTEKENRPHIGENHTFFHISPLKNQMNLNFDFSHLFALGRHWPHCAAVRSISGQIMSNYEIIIFALNSLVSDPKFHQDSRYVICFLLQCQELPKCAGQKNGVTSFSLYSAV